MLLCLALVSTQSRDSRAGIAGSWYKFHGAPVTDCHKLGLLSPQSNDLSPCGGQGDNSGSPGGGTLPATAVSSSFSILWLLSLWPYHGHLYLHLVPLHWWPVCVFPSFVMETLGLDSEFTLKVSQTG